MAIYMCGSLRFGQNAHGIARALRSSVVLACCSDVACDLFIVWSVLVGGNDRETGSGFHRINGVYFAKFINILLCSKRVCSS